MQRVTHPTPRVGGGRLTWVAFRHVPRGTIGVEAGYAGQPGEVAEESAGPNPGVRVGHVPVEGGEVLPLGEAVQRGQLVQLHLLALRVGEEVGARGKARVPGLGGHGDARGTAGAGEGRGVGRVARRAVVTDDGGGGRVARVVGARGPAVEAGGAGNPHGGGRVLRGGGGGGRAHEGREGGPGASSGGRGRLRAVRGRRDGRAAGQVQQAAVAAFHPTGHRFLTAKHKKCPRQPKHTRVSEATVKTLSCIR